MVAAITLPDKYSAEYLDYVLDWSARLDDETLVSVVVSVLDEDSVLVDQVSHDDTKVVFWLAGGYPGRRSRIECVVATTAGRIMEQELVIRVA